MIFMVVLLALCTMSSSLHSMSTLQGYTFLSPRSQSVNAARELVGWYRFINLYEEECPYGAVTATPAFGKSFRPERISQYFFGTNQLVITGSQVANRQPNQLLADYFGLSPLFQSTVDIKPRITTFLVDFDAYFGYQSFYIRAHAPAVWTRYAMNMTEAVVNNGETTPYPALYMAPGSIFAPAQQWTQAVAQNYTWGEVTQGIKVGNIVCAKSTAALSEIQVAAGWNFINRPRGHAGLNLRGSIPTGTRPNAEILFQPIVGNGHHAEFGVGFTGHIVLWEKDGSDTFSFYTDANLTHLFNSSQIRSFDLCNNGFFSRYMLVKQFDASGNYNGNTASLINFTTLPCKVNAAIQLDLAIMFGFIHKRWSLDLGYDAWLRTHHNITLDTSIATNALGLKGIQNTDTLSGFSNTTQSTATIFGNSFADQAAVADPAPPVFLSPNNINKKSAEAPLGFTNKIFWHLSYVFDSRHCFEPFLGIGGEVEFEGLNPRTTADLDNFAVSQWFVWIKGGLAF